MIQSATFWVVVFASVILFWLLPKRFRLGFLLLVSVGYLGSLALPTVLAMAVWGLAFFWLAPLAARPSSSFKWFLPALILAVLAYLSYFKYIPPLVEALSSTPTERNLIIPLGISYFTFKMIHYAIETARGNIEDRSLQRFLCYVFLFPIFTAGPIERFDHFVANQEERWNLESTVAGLTRIVHGLVKKLFLAELVIRPFFKHVTSSEILLQRLEALSPLEVWAFLFLTYVIVYLDFSAYSDIAIGISRLFGFRIMENFNFPFIASNISNFWKRWHMSLSGWCQTYVYMPMIGLTRNPYLATYSSFLVMGLWHSGSWVRVGWGVYHATGTVLYVLWSRFKRKRKWRIPERGLWRLGGIAITTIFVVPSVAFLTVEEHAGIYEATRILAKLVCVDLPA